MNGRLLLGASLLVGFLLCSCEKTDKNYTTTVATAAPTSAAHNQGKSCIDCHDWNVVSLHNKSSPDYNGDCILCHGDMTDGTTLSSSVQAIHPKMCPYVYQAAGQTTINSTVCVYCHESVDIQDGSAGNIRKQVAASKCVSCHTVAGPGRQLYIQ